MNLREKFWKSKLRKQIETKKTKKVQKVRIKSLQRFSEKSQGPFWINVNLRNLLARILLIEKFVTDNISDVSKLM